MYRIGRGGIDCTFKDIVCSFLAFGKKPFFKLLTRYKYYLSLVFEIGPRLLTSAFVLYVSNSFFKFLPSFLIGTYKLSATIPLQALLY